MTIPALPKAVEQLLNDVQAPTQLHRHLQLVHATAQRLLTELQQEWPALQLDAPLILFGAATHDIGKAQITRELHEPGKAHELAGEQLLLDHGFTKAEARFASTHGDWRAESLPLEDLLMSLSDKLWKGKRVQELEEKVGQALATQLGIDYWEIYSPLDQMLEQLSTGADERLLWQNQGS